MTERAVVLGGGGVAGIAWETGLLAGLASVGVDVLAADLFVGTSAGAAVAAQVTGPTSLTELYERQVDPTRQAPEIPAEADAEQMMALFGGAYTESTGPADLRRRIGAIALAARTVPEADRLAVIAARLPSHEWPTNRLVIVAVDAHTGEVAEFDKNSGVSLVDAVAASCAVPGVWPPVTIGDSRYVDGGVRSAENADLAAGHGRVLVLQVIEMPELTVLGEQVAALREQGAMVEVVRPDDTSMAAMGTNLLDPAVRSPSARAGFEQGIREASRISGLWR